MSISRLLAGLERVVSFIWFDLVRHERDPRPRPLPQIDGVSLIDLARAFEEGRGYSPAGGYTGPADEPDEGGSGLRRLDPRSSTSSRRSRICMLGCERGSNGCWPLSVEVIVDEDELRWSDFAHPRRPEWDYSDLGPFVFDRTQFEDAVAAYERWAKRPALDVTRRRRQDA